MLLAERWDGAVDPEGWWLSEKLDGVRAYWDGKQILSRLGTCFRRRTGSSRTAERPLDGELFLDRKSFQKTIAIVRRQDKSDLWKKIRYLIFDAPVQGGSLRSGWSSSGAAVHDVCVPCIRTRAARGSGAPEG